MQAVQTELELVDRFRKARQQKMEAKKVLELASKEYDVIERELIEALEAKGATTTAKYQGVGFVSLTKPRVYASYVKDNERDVFDFLKAQERADLIRETVAPQSLSGFVKELLEQGKPVPESINYYLKPGARFYDS